MSYDFHSSALRPIVDKSLINGWVWGGVVAVSLLSLLPVQGQVIPDATLGAGNNSVTATTGNRTDILGGLRRNSSLFHSFDRFDVLTNQQVYFANPADIRNIFSRVTGGNISNIDGLLGVSGSANLFLMNPNGMIFGPNARLDVAGSFLATTANALEFADNQKFAATGDLAVPLVEVNIPIGVQFGANPPAMLTNRGNLATGQNLTLAAGNLDLQGQVRSGGDLTLNATDTVRIRDTVTEPFLARSGGNMTIQGNQSIDVLALNHLSQTPFVSDGNFSLISDGVISGDAHFSNRGTFTIKSLAGQPADFISLYDPIISSVGNVDIAGNYTGTSLLIESQQNVQIQGNVTITGPDTVSAFQGGDTVLGGSPGFIIRSGQTNLVYGGTNQNTPPPTVANTPNIPAGITVNGTVSSFPPQRILPQLNVDFQSLVGSIDVRRIITNGGSINLNSARGSITTNGSTLDTTSISSGGARTTNVGGSVTLAANNNILLGDVSTSPFLGNFSNSKSGQISARTTNGSIRAGNLITTASFGDGGTINLVAQNGNINTSNLDTRSLGVSAFGGIGGISSLSGVGGRIILDATNGTIDTGNLDTSASGTTSGFGPSRFSNIQAGAINLTTVNGDIRATNFNANVSAPSDEGRAGTITLSATNGRVDVGNLSAVANTLTGRLRDGGAITVSATGGDLVLKDLLASSFNGGGSDIQLRSDGSILTGSLVTTGKLGSGNIQVATGGVFAVGNSSGANALNILSSDTFGSGRSGDIQIDAQSISLSQGSQISASTHSSGNGGNITLFAPALVQFSGASAGGSLPSVPTGVTGGASDSVYLGGYIPTGVSSQATNPNLIFPSGVFSQATINSTGNAGNITITTGQLLVQDSAAIGVTTFGQGNAGSVNILAQDIGLDNGSIFSGVAPGSVSTSGTIALQGIRTLQATNSRISVSTDSGVAGNVTITADQGNAPSIRLNNSTIEAAARQAAGQAGGVAITTPTLALSDSKVITSNLNATRGGSVTFTNLDSFTALNSLISASTESGVGGNVAITGVNLQLNNSAIAATTASGSAGNLSINASGNVGLNNNSRLTVAATAGGTAGNLTVQAGKIRINQSEITVSSPTGPSGNLTLSTPDLRLNRGTLSAETGGSGSGANITLEGLREPLILRNGSLISARALGNANGGNITILSPAFILGPALEGNDIIANAISGNGGKITITTNTIFGLTLRPGRTPRSDITANSETGASGSVDLNTTNLASNEDLVQLPNLAPSQGRVQLPETLVAYASQVNTNRRTQGCVNNGDSKTNESSFGIASRGGVPASPTRPFAAAIPTQDWVSLDSSPALGGVTFSNGITLDLVAQSDLSPVTCINAWKLQQRSRLSPSPLSPAQHEVFKTQQRAQRMLLAHPRFRRVPPLGAPLVRVEHWL